MSKIIITGASGMLGRSLMREMVAHDPIGTAFSRAKNRLERLNLTDEKAVTDFFLHHRPEIIIHTAAERRPDISETKPEQTMALNVAATRHLARTAKAIGAFVIYLSTDYVFDGTQPPYAPGDTTNPLNVYGRTKRDGEQALFAETEDAAVLRVGVLFGEVETPGESAVTALVDIVRNQNAQGVDDWARRYPTYIPDLAVVIRQMTDHHLAQKSMQGIWHWCGDEQYSKYAQACLIGEILHLPTDHLTANPGQPSGALRPRDCGLDCTTLEALGIGQRTPFTTALKQALEASGIT